MQRRGNTGNFLEIVDVRPVASNKPPLSNERIHSATLSPALEEGACGAGLRAGWNASRECRCNSSRIIVNCAPE